ncbi:hypothetical protein KCM76_05380, partial [Zooshikella marina]
GLNYTAGGGTTSGGTTNTPRETSYVYDALNRLARVDNPQGSTRYQYDLSGLLLRTLYPNNASISQSYDGAGRILAMEHRVGDTLVSQFQYQYDANGNRLQQIARNGSTLETTTYTYDTLDRLQQVTYPEQQVTYAYDAVYNRIRETTRDTANNQVTKDQGFSYNFRNELLEIKDLPADTVAVSYQYDANGNQTQKQKAGVTTDFVYDIRDHLRQVMQGGSSVGQFLYDTQGLRVEKLGNRGLERYTYDDQSVLAQLDSTNQPIAHYDYGPGRLMALTHRDEGTAFYHFDALGSIVNLTTTTGAVQTRTLYDAWGHHRLQEGDSWNRFGFTGHEEDPETGLVYAKARFYDPDVGRFLSMDAWEGDLTLAPSLHKYLYAYGNPLVWVDLYGSRACAPSDLSADCDAGTGFKNLKKAQAQTAESTPNDLKQEQATENRISTSKDKDLPPLKSAEDIEKEEAIKKAYARLERYCETPGMCTEGYYESEDKGHTKESTDSLNTEVAQADDSISPEVKEYEKLRKRWSSGAKTTAEVTSAIGKGLDEIATPDAVDIITFPASAIVKPVKGALKVAGELSDARKAVNSRKATNMAGSGCTPCCFTQEALVLIPDGYKPINKIKVGELVFAKSEETGEVGWKAVTHKFVYDDNRLTYKLVLKNDDGKEERFELTDNHPFYVEGKGWVDAINLRPSMLISGYNGSQLQVVSLEALDQSPITYNLEVEGYHTFFVGELGVWVHNAKKKCCIIKNEYPKDFSTKDTINRSAKYVSERDARNLARSKIGKDPVQVEPNKLRSRDGKWQYRGKPEDLRGHKPTDSPHIHLERLNPITGEVIENWHLRW